MLNMTKDVLFYFILPIMALIICSLFGKVGLIIALVLTLCVQFYTFRESHKNKKQIDNLIRNQNGLDDALLVKREEDGTVTNITIDAGEY